MSKPRTDKHAVDIRVEQQRRCSSAECKKDADTFVVVFGNDNALVDLPLCLEHLHEHGLDYALPEGVEVPENTTDNEFDECEIHAVIYPKESWKCSVVLRSKSSPSLFECVINHIEASAIVHAIRFSPSFVPSTHNLLSVIIKELGGAAEEVILHGFDPASNHAVCYLALRSIKGKRLIECRFSDALPIAAASATISIKVQRGFMNKRWGAGRNE